MGEERSPRALRSPPSAGAQSAPGPARRAAWTNTARILRGAAARCAPHAGAWLATVGLLAFAIAPRQPWLFAVRAAIVPLTIAAVAVLLVVARRLPASGRMALASRRLLPLALVAALFAAAAGEHRFQARRHAVLAGDDAMRRVGAHFMVGFSRFDEVAALARQGLIGGVYLGRDYARGRPAAQIRAEIDALQALRRAAGLPPLLVAADQEGGCVAHLSPPLPPMPALASLLAAGSDATLETRARRYGRAQGAALAELGVNLNLGPVVDLRPRGGGPRFDTHTRLGERAIAADPALVARVATAYGDGLRESGVRPTLKHFPGLGRSDADTHHFPAMIAGSRDELARSDWQPFRRAATADDAIMLAHATLPAVDAQRPASLSRRVVGGLLRGEWAYDGLLMTDDLNMGAVFRKGICNTAVDALAAGVDLLLISYDPDQYYAAIACAATAAARGTLTDAALAASRRRIARTASRPVAGSTPESL